MESLDYKTLLHCVTQNVAEGILIADKLGIIVLYNDMMSQLEKTKKEDALGRHIRDVFSYIPEEKSTLSRALNEGKRTENLQQTFINQYGKEVMTINTTVPIKNDRGEIIGAIEIAKDITNIKNLSNTLMDLQGKAMEKNKGKSAEIKRYTFDHLIGQNRDFLQAIEKSRRAARVNASVLIYGETGTGKELIAQSIHYESDRKKKPFLAQNCSALPESLLEGILFGTAKGSFTGAVDREGLFEQADGGTLLLDEISAMPYNLQSKLLRVLQENYIRRLGATKDTPVDVRIIATINQPAEELIAAGKLRTDLYYRLKIIEINIPPLRERTEDISTLTEYFLQKYNCEYKKQVSALSSQIKNALVHYTYPGNVRELEHIIMSIVSMADDGQCFIENTLDIPMHAATPRRIELTKEIKELGLEEYLNSIERAMICEAIESSGSISKAAKKLGIRRQTLQYRMKKYKIQM